MLKKYFLLVCVCMSLYTQGQVVNVNPDPNGPPWWAGGVRELTPEDHAKLDALPKVQLTEASVNTTLPPIVDNTTQKFMRPVFNQVGASCAQAAGIAYTFTYEINRVRDLPANDDSLIENHYPTHYTWNFLNGGYGYGSWYVNGWDIVKENGCPNVDDWGGMSGDHTKWMSGYDKYYRGMHNKVQNIQHISFGSITNLNILKHWLNDHGTGATTGGVACFSVNVNYVNKVVLPAESYAAEQQMIIGWGNNNSHSMTIVGYNDSIKYDFNGDGRFTNDEDINGDGIVDLKDYEIGALQILNSWGGEGTIYKSKYMAYRLLGYPGEFIRPEANMINVVTDYQPQITYKVRMKHSERQDIKLQVGYSSAASSTSPSEIAEYSSFNEQGGSHPMQGYANSDPIELGLDVGYWFLDKKAAKYYFIVHSKDVTGSGNIESFSLIDYRWGETFEVPCEQTNVPIPHAIGSTMLSINYDLLPHEEPITENLFVRNTKISRFTTRVNNGATLEIANGKTIEMYNSTIIISPDALLSLGSNSKIIAKQGNCEIIINGNINLENGAKFIKSGADTFKITINQDENPILLNDAYFTGVSVESHVKDLEVKNCHFTNVKPFESAKGNINIHDCSFNSSNLLIKSLEQHSYNLTIKKCSFNNIVPSSENAIDISAYKNIFINQNHINNYKNGIYLFNCGQNQSNALLVYANEIHNCSEYGVVAYHVSGDMIDNNIYNNQIGVALHNACNINIYGDIPNYMGVKSNIIHDNNSYQLYISENSFPPHFRLNQIIDENNTVPLVFYDANTNNVKNMAYNCFGNNFDPSEDLYPLPTLNYEPIYCYSGMGDTSSREAHEKQYEKGILALTNNNFANAKDIFKGVVENYPNTTSSQAALKAMFDTEALGNQDFSNLKSFYDSNTVIQNHPNLQKLARGLSNNCDVSMEAYQQAINYYENIIANPESTSDSIYAIIDLGYVYLLMQNGTGDKGQNLGKYYNYTKSSLTNYIPYRDKLLSLLPSVKKDKPYDTFFGLPHQTCEAYVAPNPFTQSATVYYSLQHKARMRYVLYNYLGQEVKAAALGVQAQGENTFQINNIPTGIYMLQLWADNKPIATLKIQSNK